MLFENLEKFEQKENLAKIVLVSDTNKYKDGNSRVVETGGRRCCRRDQGERDQELLREKGGNRRQHESLPVLDCYSTGNHIISSEN